HLLHEGLGLGFPVLGQFAPHHAALELGSEIRIALAVFAEQLLPVGFERRAAALGIPAFVDVGGDLEGRILPAELLAAQGHFVRAQGRTVAGLGAFLVGGTVADDGLAADQRRLVGLARLFYRPFDRLGIVAVHL